MTGESPETVLKRHFPEITKNELRFYTPWLSSGWLTAGSLSEAIELKDVAEKLKRIEKTVNALWQQYHELPLMVRSGDKDDLWLRIMRLKYDLTGKAGLLPSPNSNKLEYPKQMPPKEGAVRRMAAKAQTMPNMHHHARDNEAPAKIQLAQTCQDIWVDLKGNAPPKKPSSGTAYANFVGDVILLSGKSWSVDATLSQFSKHSDG